MPQANSTTSRPRLHLAARVGEHLAVLGGDRARPARRRAASTSSRNANSTWVRAASERLRPGRRTRLARAGDRGVDVGRARRARTSSCCGAGGGVVDGGVPVAEPAVACAADPVLDGLGRRSGPSLSLLSVRRESAGGRWAALGGVVRRSRACGVESSAETSATGTSHQDSLLGAPEPAGRSRRGSRSGRRRAALALPSAFSQLGDGRATRITSAPRLSALAARSTGSMSPSQPSVAACGGGTACRTAASRATPTARRSRRSRGSGPGRR